MRKVIAAILLGLALAAPGHATQDQWPALFDVAGVASDDVLNIRAAPSASAEIIGTLDHNATGVEVIRPNPREAWGLVNTGGGVGWVSLAYLRRTPGQWLGAEPALQSCGGTEPFWTLRFDAEGLSYETPEARATGARLDRWSGENRRDVHAFSLRLDTETGATAQDGVAIVTLGQCFDGMSDREYGLRIDMVLGTASEQRLLSGCYTLQAR